VILVSLLVYLLNLDLLGVKNSQNTKQSDEVIIERHFELEEGISNVQKNYLSLFLEKQEQFSDDDLYSRSVYDIVHNVWSGSLPCTIERYSSNYYR
jgi:hypothetical protein